ncbi:hypothetical protein WSM22_46890 [Cytophagales bacterium WSM2-2]|nr:hypothetical protein WSM22_46890 [Cytophagales bacterium WSM2-2]
MRYIFILLALTICSCTKEHDDHLYIGELYFNAFQLGSYYNLDDSTRIKFEYSMDTPDLSKADSSQLKFIALYKKIKGEGLLYKPFIDLRLNDSSYVKLYLDSADYDKIKVHKWRDLLDKQKKVIIWGRTKEIGRLDFPLLYCTELVDVEVKDGQTFPVRQGKFKINDYE